MEAAFLAGMGCNPPGGPLKNGRIEAEALFRNIQKNTEGRFLSPWLSFAEFGIDLQEVFDFGRF